MNKILRRRIRTQENGNPKIDLMIDSGGGQLDATVKIAKTLKKYSNDITAVVPFYAKSAATYLALSSKEILMCCSGELGPLDPQVKETVTGTWIPAHSIKKALGFIEGTADEMVKLQLADKLPPLLVGAYLEAQDSSKQYLEELYESHKNKEKIVDFFTEKFLSHGYPIDDEQCKQLGLNIKSPDKDLENELYDLYELYTDLTPLFNEEEVEEWLMLQTDNDLVILLDGQNISEQVKSTIELKDS